MEPGRITFSIVVPTYNRADKLKICLESLLHQTYPHFEIIVCDDGSTDNSGEVVAAFKNKGLNLTYIYTSNWGGPARPRNLGIAAAKAEWICFLDSDDYWYKNKLEAVVQVMGNTDLVYHDLDMEYASGEKKRMKARKIGQPPFIDLLVDGNTIFTSTVCVRTHLLKEINGFSEDKALVAVEDYDLWLRLAANGCRFHHLPQSLGAYWVGGGNITGKDARQVTRIDSVYDRYLPLLNKRDREFAARMKAYKQGKVYHEMADYKQAIACYRKSMFANNTVIRLKSAYFLLKAALRMGT